MTSRAAAIPTKPHNALQLLVVVESRTEPASEMKVQLASLFHVDILASHPSSGLAFTATAHDQSPSSLTLHLNRALGRAGVIAQARMEHELS